MKRGHCMRCQSNISWMKSVFPEGIEPGESTLISGPGGSGKPLVELGFVSDWLKAGGSVIGIPLQYPSLDMVHTSIRSIYRTELEDYPNRVAMIRFDPKATVEITRSNNIFAANLILPGVLEQAIEKAASTLADSPLGTLVFGSALNLLLFNERYRPHMIEAIKNLLKFPGPNTVMFTVSNNVFEKDVTIWEETADNLMFTTLDQTKTLTLRVERMKSVPFSSKDTIIPIDQQKLKEIETVAQKSRTKNIKAIKSIP
jgi:hypothetical protein